MFLIGFPHLIKSTDGSRFFFFKASLDFRVRLQGHGRSGKPTFPCKFSKTVELIQRVKVKGTPSQLNQAFLRSWLLVYFEEFLSKVFLLAGTLDVSNAQI